MTANASAGVPAPQHFEVSALTKVFETEEGPITAVEDVGFRKGPTPRGIAGLMAAAAAVLPIVQDLPLVETWAGFRPATPDHMPVIGADPDLSGLIYATGHYRNGILLAPITAACVAALIDGANPPVDVRAFRVERFAAK